MFFVPSAILAFIPNPIISTNEAWFLSNTEKVHALFRKINEVIDKVNSYEELFKELKDILTEFDDTVKKAVEDYIKQLYESGELRKIIQDIITPEITRLLAYPSKSTELDFRRMFRKLYNTGENNTYNNDTTQYTYTQGCVHFKRNDTNYCAVALKCSNYNDMVRYSNTAKIVIYNMTTNELVGSTNLTVGHANSLTYDPINDYIYIAWDYTHNITGNSTQTVSKSVSRIKFIDIVNNTPNNSFETATPDHSEFPQASATISFYNGKLYVGQRNYFCEYDFDNDTVINTYMLKNDNNLNGVTYIQDMAINDKYVALLSFKPSRIYLYDKNTLNLVWVYNIPSVLNCRMYRLLEPEAITLKNDGTLYLFTGGHTARKEFNAYDMFQVFKQNIYTNTEAQLNTHPVDRRGRNIEIFLSSSATNENPDGTSDKPFRIPQEAIMFIEDNENIHSGSISVKGSFAGMPIYLCSEKQIFIYTARDEESNVPIGGLAIEDCSNVTLNNLQIAGLGSYAHYNSSTDSPYFNLRNNVICCRHGNLNISNCIIVARNGTENGINGKYMFVNYSGDNATTASQFIDNVDGRQFLVFTDSTVNARGKAPNNSNVFDPSSINYTTNG